MNRYAFAALSVLAVAGPALAQRGGDQASKYGWLSSLEAGKSEARRTGKPLMVAIRCVP
jgi:hypothetical protein